MDIAMMRREVKQNGDGFQGGGRLESAARQGEPMMHAGQPAPSFSLPDAEMETFELQSVLGKLNVVLYFYPKDNTPGCILQAIDFSDHESDFTAHEAIVIGVSPDDCLTHADFCDKHGLSVRLLSDEEGEVCRMFGVLQERQVDGVLKQTITRSTFVIDKQGIIRHALYGVNPRGHSAEVLELVKQLDSGVTHASRQKHRRHSQLPGNGPGWDSD